MIFCSLVVLDHCAFRGKHALSKVQRHDAVRDRLRRSNLVALQSCRRPEFSGWQRAIRADQQQCPRLCRPGTFQAKLLGQPDGNESVANALWPANDPDRQQSLSRSSCPVPRRHDGNSSSTTSACGSIARGVELRRVMPCGSGCLPSVATLDPGHRTSHSVLVTGMPAPQKATTAQSPFINEPKSTLIPMS